MGRWGPQAAPVSVAWFDSALQITTCPFTQGKRWFMLNAKWVEKNDDSFIVWLFYFHKEKADSLKRKAICPLLISSCGKSEFLYVIFKDLPSKACPTIHWIYTLWCPLPHPMQQASCFFTHHVLFSPLLSNPSQSRTWPSSPFSVTASTIPFPTSSHRLTKERQALSGIHSPLIVWGAYNFYFSLNYHLFKGEKLAFLSMPHSEHYRLQTGGLNKHLLTARLTHVFNFLARRGQQTVEGTSSSCEGSRASKLATYWPPPPLLLFTFYFIGCFYSFTWWWWGGGGGVLNTYWELTKYQALFLALNPYHLI